MRRSNALIWLIFSGFLAPAGAFAQTAAELFAEANDLVRAESYRAALLRYREAAAAGFDTPLLHYNLGIVNFRLGEFDTAATEFAAAASEPALAALASYNRGLAQRAAGNHAAAAESFRSAAQLAGDGDLRRLAERAAQTSTLESTPAPPSRAGSAPARRAPREETEPIGELQLVTAARVGHDDNAYRSPSSPYVDLAAAGRPLVTPVPQSASFMPLEVRAAYVLENASGDTEFVFRYDLNGDFYSGEFSRANEIDQTLSMGADITLGAPDKRRRAVETAFFVRAHEETNFDPDDGLAREINGQDISDRFAYRGAGVQGDFAHDFGPWGWGVEMRFERREYEQTALVANFDHDYFYTGVDLDYDLNDATVLRFGLSRYRRLYDNRGARNLTGALLSTNPAQDYGYSGLRLGVARKFGREFELSADYMRVERIDEFLGYYDYTQDMIRLRATFRPTSRFDIVVAGVARSYDYPRALAFNVAAGGPREHEDLSAEISAKFRITPRLALWAAFDTVDVTSTDARLEYARARTMLGVEWRR